MRLRMACVFKGVPPPLSQNSCRLKFLKKIKFEIRDKTNIKYSEGFKKQALAKVYNRGNAQTIQDIADDLNISLQTLKTWMKKVNLTEHRRYR